MVVRKTLYKKKKGKENNKKNPPASYLAKNKNNNLLMHKRNLHRSSFTNFEELGHNFPYINLFLKKNEKGKLFYDFRHSLSTYFLSKALLKQYYGIEFYLPYVYKIHHFVDFPIFCDQQKNGYGQKLVQLQEEGDQNADPQNKTGQLKEKVNMLYDKHNQQLNLLLPSNLFVSEKSEEKSYEEGDIKGEVSKCEKMYSKVEEKEMEEQNGQEQKTKEEKIGENNIVEENMVEENMVEEKIGEENIVEENIAEENIVKEKIREMKIEKQIIQKQITDKKQIIEEQITETGEDKFLCPCVPGRVNYIHLLSDLATYNKTEAEVELSSNECKQYILSDNLIKVLDIGVGANCIYPLLGNNTYNWTFVGSDINLESLKIAYLNILINNQENNIKLKFQKEKDKIFFSIIDKKNLFFFSMCNPPFYSELEELNQNPHRYLDAKISEVLYSEVKNDNVFNHEKKTDNLETRTEFSNKKECEDKGEGEGKGKGTEENKEDDTERSIKKTNEQIIPLYIPNPNATDINSVNKFERVRTANGRKEGGEYSFILKMLQESTFFFYNIIWFTSLVSKLKNVKLIKQEIINSMRSYITHGSNQISFLDSLIHNNIYFDDSFYYKNVNDGNFPVFISQYRILKSYQGKITRWIICWSYFNERQIDIIKNLYYRKCLT